MVYPNWWFRIGDLTRRDFLFRFDWVFRGWHFKVRVSWHFSERFLCWWSLMWSWFSQPVISCRRFGDFILLYLQNPGDLHWPFFSPQSLVGGHQHQQPLTKGHVKGHDRRIARRNRCFFFLFTMRPWGWSCFFFYLRRSSNKFNAPR